MGMGMGPAAAVALMVAARVVAAVKHQGAAAAPLWCCVGLGARWRCCWGIRRVQPAWFPMFAAVCCMCSVRGAPFCSKWLLCVLQLHWGHPVAI